MSTTYRSGLVYYKYLTGTYKNDFYIDYIDRGLIK